MVLLEFVYLAGRKRADAVAKGGHNAATHGQQAICEAMRESRMDVVEPKV
jgi:hypothetical protein